jgi:ABC-type multidrug transport system ATPase subunit
MVADSMIILHKGEKIAEGKVKELLDPANTLVTIETNQLVSAINLIQESKWCSKLVSNHALKFEMDKAAIPLLVQFLVEHQIPISNIQSNHSLENYFLKLTNA